MGLSADVYLSSEGGGGLLRGWRAGEDMVQGVKNKEKQANG